MAIYHFSAKIVGRGGKRRRSGKTRNVVAKAAYNCRETQVDENTGRRHPYYGREKCVYSRIYWPDGAPEWLSCKSRQALWSAVEACEKRRDAQLAREFVVALPAELTLVQNIRLLESYIKRTFTSMGMVADLAVHPPPDKADGPNHHAHVLLTMRAVGGQQFGKKERTWNSRTLLMQWRRQWERVVNMFLEHYGHRDRVSCKSLKAQGLEREPLIHIRQAAIYAERWGRRTIRGNKIRDIQELNSLRNALSRSDVRSHIDAAMENSEKQSNLPVDEEARAVALANIGQVIRSNQQLKPEDLHGLTLEDLELIKELDVNEVHRLIRQLECHREMVRER